MRQILSGQECVTEVNDNNRHDLIQLTLELDPLTNYVLDITTDTNSPASTPPMFRRSFSTSRYKSASALADSVKNATPHHRFLEDVSPLVKLSSDHPGATAIQVAIGHWEMALRSAQWGDLGPITQSQVSVIWQDGGAGEPPQPAAVLIGTTQPLWRQRQTPIEVRDKDQVKRFILQPATFLEVADSSASGPLAARFISSPGGGRTLVLLAAGARGRELKLTLNRHQDPLFELNSNIEPAALLDVSLAAAHWEEQE